MAYRCFELASSLTSCLLTAEDLALARATAAVGRLQQFDFAAMRADPLPAKQIQATSIMKCESLIVNFRILHFLNLFCAKTFEYVSSALLLSVFRVG